MVRHWARLAVCLVWGAVSASAAGVAPVSLPVVAITGVPFARILAAHDALLIGESHSSLASVVAMSRSLPVLARSGVKVLGIEGLKRRDQAAVDAYVSGRSDALPARALGFSPSRQSAFQDLLASARESNVRVVALGLPLKGWASRAAALAAAKTGDPVETFAGTPAEQLHRAQTRYERGYNEAVAEVYLTRRNKSMARFLGKSMPAGAKAVVLVGQVHIDGEDDPARDLMRAPGDWGTLGRELESRGLKPFSLTLTGGLYTDARSAADDRAARPAAHRRAAAAAPKGEPAWRKTGPSTGLWHAGASKF